MGFDVQNVTPSTELVRSYFKRITILAKYTWFVNTYFSVPFPKALCALVGTISLVGRSRSYLASFRTSLHWDVSLRNRNKENEGSGIF